MSASTDAPVTPSDLLSLCRQNQCKLLQEQLHRFQELKPGSQQLVQLQLAMKDSAGFTPLLIAAKCGWHDVVQQMINMGAEMHACLHASGNTALHLAALHGHLQVVRCLLGATVTAQTSSSSSSNSSSPAADEHHNEPVDEGALVDATNRHGDTPLMFACGAGHVGVAAMLLKVGRHNQDNIYHSMRWLQNLSWQAVSVDKLYVLYVTGVLWQPAGSHCVLNCAALKYAFCLQAGATPVARNASGLTPLLAAVGHGHEMCCKLLLKHAAATQQQQALLSVVDVHGNTPLHFACSSGEQRCGWLLRSPGNFGALRKACFEAQAGSIKLIMDGAQCTVHKQQWLRRIIP